MLPAHRLPRLRVSGTKVAALTNDTTDARFIIGIRGWAIVEVGATNRQSLLAYKSRQGAERALTRARQTYPQAEVYERGES